MVVVVHRTAGGFPLGRITSSWNLLLLPIISAILRLRLLLWWLWWISWCTVRRLWWDNIHGLLLSISWWIPIGLPLLSGLVCTIIVLLTVLNIGWLCDGWRHVGWIYCHLLESMVVCVELLDEINTTTSGQEIRKLRTRGLVGRPGRWSIKHNQALIQN